MGDILFALFATVSIYLMVNIIKLTRSFFVYKKAKKAIIYAIYSYFNKYDSEYADLKVLKKVIEKKLKKIDILKRVEFLELKWKERGTFQLKFKLNYRKSYPVHSFSFNVNKIKKTLDYKNSEV